MTATPPPSWPEHVAKWENCQRCPLGMQRGNMCLARGDLPADVLFVGEAPGMSEDVAGLPFVGPAGRLLDEIIARSVPKGVYYALTNLVACFPREAKERGDNEPEYAEILECRPRLYEFINLVQPRLIVCVGRLATDYVDHGRGVPCVDIVHPAHILARMPAAQKGFATQRCIVQIKNAIEDYVINATPTEFQEWSTSDAQGKSKRQKLKTIYDSAGFSVSKPESGQPVQGELFSDRPDDLDGPIPF